MTSPYLDRALRSEAELWAARLDPRWCQEVVSTLVGLDGWTDAAARAHCRRHSARLLTLYQEGVPAMSAALVAAGYDAEPADARA